MTPEADLLLRKKGSSGQRTLPGICSVNTAFIVVISSIGGHICNVHSSVHHQSGNQRCELPLMKKTDWHRAKDRVKDNDYLVGQA
jgi:hypothetical protein